MSESRKVGESAGTGNRGKGRKPGVPNKTTREAKEALATVFDKLGGDEALLVWAREHLDTFYTTIWPKLLPLQVNGTHDVNHHDDEARVRAEERADKLMRELTILGGTAALSNELGLSADIRPAPERLQ